VTEVELMTERTKMLIVVHREGKVPHRDRFDPIAAKQRYKHADLWGVDRDVFDEWCEKARAAGTAMKFPVAEPPAADKGTFLVRKMEDPRDKAVVYTAEPSRFVKDILPSVPNDQIAEWDDLDTVCMLDVDYHDTTPPARDWLDSIVRTRIDPKPLAWHFSRSGGLHLFYVSAGDFRADELAACAALRFRAIDRSAGLELKSVGRGPGVERVHTTKDQDTGAGLIDWLGTPEYEEESRDSWLESEGMECGRRYDHEKCPIDPSPGAERTPVLVSEAGIYCFRCNGKGLTFGSRRPGWAPWPAILGSPSAGELGGLIRNMVHWGHAKWVLTERYGLPEGFAKLAYKAALKAYHAGRGNDPSLGLIFHQETEGLARVNNLWMTIDESHTYKENIAPILRCLPAAVYADADGKAKVSEATVCEMNQTKDQSRRGYRNIQVVHGFKMASVFLGDNGNHTTVAVVNPTLRALTNRGLPKYVPGGKRMPMDEARGLIETVLPRIDWTYITALLIAFACSQETRSGLLPILFASGPSSVGKTAMAQVAAGIIGARVGAEATFDPEPSRFRQNVFEGGQQGPVVVFNELLKDATRGRNKLSVREALDFVLNMTPNSTSHMLYRGPVKMGKLPTLVITDTGLPERLNEQTQLARRIRHMYISGRKEEWKSTIAAAGITDLHLIRTASDQVARACDAILSDVVDTHFAIPSTWDELADSIGVKTIEHSEEFTDPMPWLRELFRLVCAAPALTERERKLYADGYKKVSRGSGSPAEEEDNLTTVYSMFADGPGSDWCSSRRLLEKDWSDVLKVGDTVKLDLRGTGDAVYLRFRVGPAKTPTAVNEKIVNPSDWEKKL
jgi:hypothetical protein